MASEFFENKNPVTTILIVVIALAAVLAIFSRGDVSGSAIRTEVETLPFPVYVEDFAHDGWGDCTNKIIKWESVDDYCKSLNKNYAGAAPEEWQPCLHITSPTRWYWDGNMPMQKGPSFTVGLGLVRVKCMY